MQQGGGGGHIQKGQGVAPALYLLGLEQQFWYILGSSAQRSQQ